MTCGEPPPPSSWTGLFQRLDECRGRGRGSRLEASLVKNESCLAWGVSRLGNDSAPWSSSLRCLGVDIVESLWTCVAHLEESELLLPCVQLGNDDSG
jgi:hypothetical protein